MTEADMGSLLRRGARSAADGRALGGGLPPAGRAGGDTVAAASTASNVTCYVLPCGNRLYDFSYTK